MATVAYREMKELAKGIEKIYRSAVCSGIAGDRRHARKGGYHIGRKYQPSSNYSVRRPDDRAGPSDGSSALDMTMGRKDIVLATRRLAGAYNNRSDPRRKYLNGFNGWDGSGPATRWDVYARKTKRATSDHKWHIHLEQRRRYIRDRVSNDAILSIMRGESVAQWLARRGVVVPRPAPKPAAGKPRPKPAPPKAPPYPGRVLRRNDRQRSPDAAVRQWQQQMRNRGWSSIGKADGLPGPAFERVVKAWQKNCRLPVDGTVGPKTWPTPWTRPIGA
jgi:hypothetical protein